MEDAASVANNRLTQTLSGRKIIYLDTRYWIFLRDVRLGRAQKSEHYQIYELLFRLFEKGKIICPVSDIMIAEVLKQSLYSRITTAAIMDELSCSICYTCRCVLYQSQLRQLISLKLQEAPIPLKVFCRPIALYGRSLEDMSSRIDPSVFKDLMEELKVSELIEMLHEMPEVMKPRVPAFKETEVRRAELEKKGQKLETTLMEHVGLHFYQMENDLNNILKKSNDARLKGVKAIHAFSWVYQELKRDAFKRKFPSFYVEPRVKTARQLLHGAKFKDGNDWWDLEHTILAVPYSHLYFTEKRFCGLIATSDLPSLYPCKVLFKENEVIAALEAL